MVRGLPRAPLLDSRVRLTRVTLGWPESAPLTNESSVVVEFLSVLARRWRIVAIFVVLGVATSAVVTQQLTPTYRAEAQLFVAFAPNDDNAVSLSQGNLFAANRVQSYTDLIESPLVLQPVIDELGLDTTPEELAEELSAETPPDTVLIELTADDSSPQRAADIANAVAKYLTDVIEDLDRTGNEPSPVQVSVTRPATPPDEPEFPLPLLNIAIGLFAGLALGLGVATLRETLDTTIRDESDVEDATGLPTLAGVPTNPDIDSTPVHVHAAASPAWSESYRKLRTNISHLDPDDPPRTLLITSALGGDGKTVTAANLAASLAQGGRRTILVEADLRRPTLGRLLGLVPDVGVTTVVAGKASRAEAIQESADFHVLTSGPIPPNPSELLGSQAFRALLAGLREDYDSVVVDTPPLIAVTDAAVTAAAVDAVLIVCQARRTTRPDLRKALFGLRAVDANVAGVVLNQTSVSRRAYFQYSYQSPGQPSRTPRRKSKGRSP